MAKAKFAVGDSVRFIGTDTIYTVRRYSDETCQYQVQRGDATYSVECVFGVYLEPAEPSDPAKVQSHWVHTPQIIDPAESEQY